LIAVAAALASTALSQPPWEERLGGFDQQSISAGDNMLPTITALESNKASPQDAGTAIRWKAKAEDPEGDTIFYQFLLNGPSTANEWKEVAGWSSDSTWNWLTAVSDAGDYKVSVRVSDDYHSEPQRTYNEKVVDFRLNAPQVQQAAEQAVPPFGPYQPAEEEQQQQAEREQQPSNQAPVMTGLTATPASPQDIGAVITWTAEADDADGDSLQFQFLLDGQPATDWQSSNVWSWNAASAGEHSITALVRDGRHNMQGDSSRDARFTVNRPNEKPVILNFAPDRASPQEAGSVIVWTAQASDPDNDPVLFKFFLNGMPVTDWQSEGQWSWQATEGEAQVQVQVRDGRHADQYGFDDERSLAFVVNAPNQSPKIINFGADRESPQQIGSAITWSAETMDIESDPLMFQFLLDGQVVQDWSESASWTWTATEAGQHTITVRSETESIAPRATPAWMRHSRFRCLQTILRPWRA